jgi:hypothetical protein
MKMTNENLRMQMLSGIITESQYVAKLNENNNPSRMVELIKMYVDNYYDGGYDSAEIALDKLNDVLNGNLDGYDKAFMAGEEDQY